MAVTATPSPATLQRLLRAELQRLNLRARSIDVWIEPAARDTSGRILTGSDGTPLNVDYLSGRIRLVDDLTRYFRAGEELGWRDEESIVRWIAETCAETRSHTGAWAVSDAGLDHHHNQIRPAHGYGWGYTLTPHIAAMTGRDF